MHQSLAEAKKFFRFRNRIAKFNANMKNGYSSIACPQCSVQPDTQIHSVQCPDVKAKISQEGDYHDIFSKNISAHISKTQVAKRESWVNSENLHFTVQARFWSQK